MSRYAALHGAIFEGEMVTGIAHRHEHRVAFDPKAAVAAVVPFAVAAAFTHPNLLAMDPLISVTAFAAIFLVTISISPFKWSSGPVGELITFLIYGPGIVIATVLLFRGTVTSDVITAATCIGLLLTNVLVAGDASGRNEATSIFGFLYVAAFVLPVITFATTGSFAVLGLLLGVLPADYAVWSLRHQPPRTFAAEAAAMIACLASAAGLIAFLLLL